MVLLSEGFEIMERDKEQAWQPNPLVRGALDRLIEQATRAGVVIYTVDSRGLQIGRVAGRRQRRRSRGG